MVAAVALAATAVVSAHDIPNDVVVQAFLKPEGNRMRLLVRVPSTSIADVVIPTRDRGYIDIARADEELRNGASPQAGGTIYHLYVFEIYAMDTMLNLPISATPDDLVKTIKNVMQVSGGVGAIIGFVHDWANPENTRRSWDMVARYVIPEINGYITKLRESQKFVIENRAVFERAGQAVMAKIMENEKAAAALQHTGPGRIAIPAVNAPDLQKEAAKRKA